MNKDLFGCIYIIFNLINEKIYIGKTTVTIQKRFKNHCKGVRAGITRSLTFAMRKHGIENFGIIWLHDCYSLKEINFFERFYIKKFKSNNKRFGYNMTTGGDDGWEANPDFKKKSRQSQLGKTLSEEHKNNIKIGVNRNPRRPVSAEERAATIKRNHERVYDVEKRKQISNARKNYVATKEQGEQHAECLRGRIWINNGKRERFMLPEKAAIFIKCGWVEGRIGNPWQRRKIRKCLRFWQKIQEPEIYFAK